jgi:hypothetical protein
VFGCAMQAIQVHVTPRDQPSALDASAARIWEYDGPAFVRMRAFTGQEAQPAPKARKGKAMKALSLTVGVLVLALHGTAIAGSLSLFTAPICAGDNTRTPPRANQYKCAVVNPGGTPVTVEVHLCDLVGSSTCVGRCFASGPTSLTLGNEIFLITPQDDLCPEAYCEIILTGAPKSALKTVRGDLCVVDSAISAIACVGAN